MSGFVEYLGTQPRVASMAVHVSFGVHKGLRSMLNGWTHRCITTCMICTAYLQHVRTVVVGSVLT